MRVDVGALGACSRLAERGAGQAANALAAMTGTDLRVEVTGANLATSEELADSFGGTELIGVQVGLRNGLDGEAVLAFDAAAIDTVRSLLPGDGSADRSAVTELGNIALGGFLDGWANHLDAAIDMTPPTYVEADEAAVLPDGAQSTEGVFLFESRMEATTVDLDFAIYLLPNSGPMRDLLVGRGAGRTGDGRVDDGRAGDGRVDDGRVDDGSRGGSDGTGPTTAIPYDSLSTFAALAERGSANAADNIATMTGLETSVDVSRLRFVPLADLPAEVGEERRAGTVFELTGQPSGYLAILFDEASAVAVAEAMLPMAPDDPLGDMGEQALKELGNVMTSGLIDGWANVLGTSIEHSPPEYVHDIGSAAISPLVAALGKRQEYGFVIDAVIETAETEVTCDVYALPDEQELAAVLASLDGQ
ncbi:chemotaxis protein CheC [Haloparvum sp. AD34]